MKKLLILLGVLFILENGISLGFVAVGFLDPFKYGEASQAFCTEVVEEFFNDWDTTYLKSKYNVEAKKSGVVNLALERITPLEEEYGRIKEIKEVERTSFNVAAPGFISWGKFHINYKYQFLVEFDKGEVVVDLGVMREDGGWGIRVFGMKSPLDDFVFITKKANHAVGQTE